MKIGDNHSPVPNALSGVGVPEVTASSAPTPPSNDRITTGETAQFQSAVSLGVTLATTERAARLHSLAQAVRSGGYQLNAARLADQILAQAELDARLVGLFRHD